MTELLITLANLARLDEVLNLFAKAFPREVLGCYGRTRTRSVGAIQKVWS
jgi:hypothetical protein